MIVTIHGASDDLVAIEGAITAEFCYQHPLAENADLLAFSEGTILRVARADRGVWRIATVRRGSGALVIEQGNPTDRATLTGEIAWVVQGIVFAEATS